MKKKKKHGTMQIQFTPAELASQHRHRCGMCCVVQLGRLMALLALKLGCRGENNLAVQGRYGEYVSNELQLRKQKMVKELLRAW
jgi:hypothetical protein